MGTRRDRHPTSDDRTRTRPLYDWRVTVRRGSSWRRALTTAGIASATLAVATAAVFLAEDLADVSDASTIYLFAVALVAYLSGSWAAVGSALAAFLLYNFLFVPPRFTFQVAAPQQILNLAILLVAGVGIARLTGLLRDHAQRSERREREARSLFAIGELIAGAKRIGDAFAALVTDLAVASGMDRVWIGLGPTLPLEQVAGDSAVIATLPTIGSHWVLRRSPDAPPAWIRLSPPTGLPGPRPDGPALFRLPLAEGEEVLGSLWGARDPARGQPTEEETRLLAAAADQVGQAVVRDRLSGQATELEVARRSEELKAALLDSVSHDLRTPLATIRAAAGTLADPALDLPAGERLGLASEIDDEAERLSRLVGELLDMSRIEGGALRPQLEAMPLTEIVHPALARARGSLGPRRVEVEIGDQLPAVAVDQVLVDQVLDNLIANVARHAAPAATLRISAEDAGDGMVRLRVEDGGPGVPPEALSRLFDKFYRVPGRRDPARRGTGLGLALVRGLVEAMGGTVAASASDLGGLAVDVRLPATPGPAA
jgi:two-component system, OmpR family, sensor histidine kinase KdpD